MSSDSSIDGRDGSLAHESKEDAHSSSHFISQVNGLLSINDFLGCLAILIKDGMFNKLLLRDNLPSVNDFFIAINLILDDVNSVNNMRFFGNFVDFSLADKHPHEDPK